MKVSVKNVNVEYGGEIRGLDSVLSVVVQSRNEEPGFEEADQVSKDLERLSRQLVELAWICRRFAEAGVPIGYVVEVCVTRKSIRTVQFYRVETAPPSPLPHETHLCAWHSLARLYEVYLNIIENLLEIPWTIAGGANAIREQGGRTGMADMRGYTNKDEG